MSPFVSRSRSANWRRSWICWSVIPTSGSAMLVLSLSSQDPVAVHRLTVGPGDPLPAVGVLGDLAGDAFEEVAAADDARHGLRPWDCQVIFRFRMIT